MNQSINYDNINKYRYCFRNKETSKTSYFDEYCYGNIYEQIELYKNDLKKMCLLDVSNDTHEITKVVHLFNNNTIFEESKWGDMLWIN